jgi:Bacterial type II and III secretion system protein
MLNPLARTTAVLVAGLVAAASARAQAPLPPVVPATYGKVDLRAVVHPSPPVVLPCPIPRADASQEAQVSLEVRVVTVPDQFFERIGVDFNVNTTTDKAPQPCPAQFQSAGFINDFTPDKFLSGLPHAGTCTRDLPTPVCQANTGPVFLNAKQVYEFLEGVQGDARSNVMQAPKITLFNNQMGHVDCTDKQSFVTSFEVVQRDGRPVVVPKTEDIVTGFRMSACPRVSADGRFVRLKLEVNQTDPASSNVPLCPVTVLMQDTQGRNPVPFTQFLQQPKMNTTTIETNLVIPDGGTVLLGGGKKEVEVRSECGPPVLSRVPYINRLFKNVAIGRETQTVYVLVTPRVIDSKEEEPRVSAPTQCTGAPCCTRATKAEGAKEVGLHVVEGRVVEAPAPISSWLIVPRDAEESEPVELPTRCKAKVLEVELQQAEESKPVVAPSRSQAKVMRELLKAYDEACATGHTQEAAKLAQAALILDPTCFAKSRGR